MVEREQNDAPAFGFGPGQIRDLQEACRKALLAREGVEQPSGELERVEVVGESGDADARVYPSGYGKRYGSTSIPLF